MFDPAVRRRATALKNYGILMVVASFALGFAMRAAGPALAGLIDLARIVLFALGLPMAIIGSRRESAAEREREAERKKEEDERLGL